MAEEATLVDLIQEEQWEEAWQVVARDPRAGYEGRGDEYGMRFPLHELCRMVKFINHVEDNEFSDDEDEEMFTDEQRERNQEIYRLARFIILQSQTIQTPFVLRTVGSDGVARSTRHRSVLSLTEPLDDYKTPLHVLCSESADTTMMRLIFECAPEGTMDDPLLLNQARAIDLIRTQDEFECTPVHLLMRIVHRPPFSAFKLMMEYCAITDPNFPDARLIRDQVGEIPLHWAFAVGISPRRIRALLLGCHDALLVVNDYSTVPFQEYVVECCGDFDLLDNDEKVACWSYIQAVLKVVTGSQDDDDDVTWSPLHAVASGINYVPEAIWSIALTFESDRRNTYNQDGLLPLHAAVSSPPQNAARVLHAAFSSPPRLSKRREEYLSMMREIMYSYPEAASMPTSRGRLALHLAIESSQISSVISTLLLESPHALLTIDPVTELPPFMLAAVDDINGLTTVYELLRKDPSILLSRRRRSVVAM